MKKKEAHTFFIETVAPSMRNFGYSATKNSFEREAADEGMTIKIFPDFEKHNGYIMYNVYIKIFYREFTNEYLLFASNVYPELKLSPDAILTIDIRNIVEIDKNHDISIVEFTSLFSGNIRKIESFIDKNLSSKYKLLLYFENNNLKGGIDRTLAIFSLMCGVRGKDVACKWLNGGSPYTASEYQQKQLSYLLKFCS